MTVRGCGRGLRCGHLRAPGVRAVDTPRPPPQQALRTRPSQQLSRTCPQTQTVPHGEDACPAQPLSMTPLPPPRLSGGTGPCSGRWDQNTRCSQKDTLLSGTVGRNKRFQPPLGCGSAVSRKTKRALCIQPKSLAIVHLGMYAREMSTPVHRLRQKSCVHSSLVCEHRGLEAAWISSEE